MCKIGDILLIYNAKNKRPVGMHPFIVLDNNQNTVQGIYSYDLIGLLLTSADTDEKKTRLGKIEGNFPITTDDKNMNKTTDDRFAYVEADQFFYFDKNKIKYTTIGSINPDIYNLITEYIYELNTKGIEIKQIFDKATKIE